MKKTFIGNIKKIFAFGLSVVLIFSMFGCSKKEEVTENAEITYWSTYNGVGSGVDNVGDLPCMKELMKRTGVNIEFTHPSPAQEAEQFNLLLASGEYPDVIEYSFYNYTGGPQAAIDQGIILNLNDVIKKYCPNLQKYLKNHPEVDKMIKTDEGNYYCFPCIYDGDYLLTFNGPIIRDDMLKKVGMDRPETMNEWEEMLTKFKTELGSEAPLTLTISNLYAFIQAYGTIQNMYVDKGKVVYGVMNNNFKDAIAKFRDWYSKGLIDKNFATLKATDINQKMISGEALSTIGATGGGIGNWTTQGIKNDSNYKLIAAKFPVLKKGSTPMYGHRIFPAIVDHHAASITTNCKNIEAAAKILDYGYSEEGRMLFNFGIEGESYEMINGYPTYTKAVTSNENGKSMSDMIAYYARPNGVGPSIRDVRYMEQFAALPEQKESIELWGDTNAEKHMLPLVTLTKEESDEISIIKTDISSYIDAMVLKFITGVEPMENFDAFKNKLKKMGIDKVVGVYQSAYDRYKKR